MPFVGVCGKCGGVLVRGVLRTPKRVCYCAGDADVALRRLIASFRSDRRPLWLRALSARARAQGPTVRSCLRAARHA